MSTPASRTRRRNRAVAMRGQGMTIREIAAALNVSHPTVIRDLGAYEQAGAESVIAALARLGGPPLIPGPGFGAGSAATRNMRRSASLARWQRRVPPAKRYDERSYVSDYRESRMRDVARLRERGFSLRDIGQQLGISPATVMRDLRASGAPHQS